MGVISRSLTRTPLPPFSGISISPMILKGVARSSGSTPLGMSVVGLPYYANFDRSAEMLGRGLPYVSRLNYFDNAPTPPIVGYEITNLRGGCRAGDALRLAGVTKPLPSESERDHRFRTSH
jgi:hypothetical protein